LSALLLIGGLMSSVEAAPPDRHHSPGLNKLNDKYLAGESGGRLGVGGTESVVFRGKKS
jgi:hypothetical protein